SLPSQVRVVRAHDAATLVARARELVAGDVLVLDPGTYRVSTLDLRGLTGRPDAWIMLRGTPGKTFLVGTSSRHNVVEITDCHWLRLEDIDISAPGHAVDGVKFSYGSHSSHVTLDHCRVHDVRQGITSQAALLEHLTVERCEITRMPGSGIYLGYDDPPRIAADTTIRNCWIHDVADGGTTGYGIQIKGHSHGARIENNVLHDVAGSARAVIATYYVDPRGAATPERWNVIRDNLIWNSAGEGVYVVNSAIVENNVIFDVDDGIAVTSYGGRTIDNLVLRNNTVFRCRTAGLRLDQFGAARSATCVIANNALLMEDPGVDALRCQQGTGEAVFTGNACHGRIAGPLASSGAFPVGPPSLEFAAAATGARPPALDLRPAGDSALLARGDARHAPPRDVAGVRRAAGADTDVGAFLHTD